MELTNSDYIATVALLISIASAYYAKKQSDQAKIASYNDHRAHLSETHAEYQHVLRQVTEKHRAEIDELSEEANRVYSKAICVFDRYDTNSEAARKLRHLINDCSSMVYHAFKGHLGTHQDYNVCQRLMQVTFVDEKSSPFTQTPEHRNFRELFAQKHFNNPEIYQENELLADPYFLNLIYQIRERIDATNQGKLLLEVQEILQPFNKKLKQAQPEIGNSARLLETSLEDNKLDHFPLTESPKLLHRLKYRITTYNTLNELSLLDIDQAYADKYDNFVQVSIYNFAILHAIVGFDSWGWEN